MQNEYFTWLMRKTKKTFKQRDVLEHLHSIPFRYNILEDESRANDGVELRYTFGDDMGYSSVEICEYLDYIEPSVLEVLVALAVRLEQDIMFNPIYGDRTSQWFDIMLKNLGLPIKNEDYDKNMTEQIIQTFLDGSYDPDGHGGLFVTKSGRDMRNIEIWYQMFMYLEENGYNE